MNLRDGFKMTMAARFPHRDWTNLCSLKEDGTYNSQMMEGNFQSFADGWATRGAYDVKLVNEAQVLEDSAGLVATAKKRIAEAIGNNQRDA